MNWGSLLAPEILVFMVPISGIVGGCCIAIAAMYFKHQERIELIRQGIHPDHANDESQNESSLADEEYSVSV